MIKFNKLSALSFFIGYLVSGFFIIPSSFTGYFAWVDIGLFATLIFGFIWD